MIWVAAVVVSTAALCIALGRYNRSVVAREWDMMLGPRHEKQAQALEARCNLDHLMADDSWKGAWEAFLADDRPEVLRLLELSYDVLEAATLDRRTRLRAIRVCSHMAAAIAPAPSLLPKYFERSQMQTLAGIAQVLQWILVSAHERFVVQARIVALGFILSLRAMRRERRHRDLVRAMLMFDMAKEDWKTLDEVHVEMVRILLVSVAAVRRDVVIAQL